MLYGIRRLPIFPPEAPTVRHGRSASPTLLELPALLDLLFASSSTGRAHSRSHHQPSASASLSQTQKTVIAVYETKETDGCQSLLFGIRRLPIFPPEAPTVRHGRSASPTLLELPALLDLLFASSSTGRAHSRSHHQPSASASLSQTQKTVIAVYETKETDGCQSLLFGIRRLPIFPGRHQPSIFGV